MSRVPATQQGKAHALYQLAARRAHPPERIDNSTLVAGSPMWFYCISCGWVAGVLPEDYLTQPPKLCFECEAMAALGWLE